MRVPTGRYSDDRLEGRKEKRLPVMVVVNLAPLVPVNAEKHERTCTDNISGHGARVRSTCAWQLGEQAEIAPTSGEPAVHGEVVYCQRLDDDRFFVGLKVRERRIPWSILQRFDGAGLS